MLLHLNTDLLCSSFFFHNHNNISPVYLPLSFKTHKKPQTTLVTATSPLITNQLNNKQIDDIATSYLHVSAEKDLKHLSSPLLEVKELEELPEQWRRSKIAWLCKELPTHKTPTLVRILNAQKKWVRQDDISYVVLHCMRIRDNDSSYKVYRWMSQQRWYNFDFALVTKLADYLGKDRKYAKCRELFDDIIRQGQVPSESTFHILIVAYLSAPIDGCIEEACYIYNKMIQLGGCRPRLSLHNSLFRALVSRTGGASKQYLKQAEFIYHNIVTTHLEVQKDIYEGLIWLHSYQDVIDKDRVAFLVEEMRNLGFEESKDLLLSIMRASSKEGDLEKVEKCWGKLLDFGGNFPSQAFIYKMELYAELGDPMKSLELFKSMKVQKLTTITAYYKIIEIMARAYKVDTAEDLMNEFIESGMKPLIPSFLELMYMYLDLKMDDKVEFTFSKCITLCSPNRVLYNIYLESLVGAGNLEKAEMIFNEMYDNVNIGTTSKSCNTLLGGYLSSDQHYEKAEKVFDIMRQKKYEVNPEFVEKLQHVFSLRKKIVKRRVSMKLDQEQREILIGLLLGGVKMESDQERRNHSIHFEFNENSKFHSSLKLHIHERFYEWLTPSSKPMNEESEIPYKFSTIAHSYFGFFAEQFSVKGRLTVPKLLHRWLSPRIMAYWYMYGGYQIPSGDVLLKLKVGNREDIERVASALKAKSLLCKFKKKGNTYWIGLQGNDADNFLEMIQSYLLMNVGDDLKQNNEVGDDKSEEGKSCQSDTELGTDEQTKYSFQILDVGLEDGFKT